MEQDLARLRGVRISRGICRHLRSGHIEATFTDDFWTITSAGTTGDFLGAQPITVCLLCRVELARRPGPVFQDAGGGVDGPGRSRSQIGDGTPPSLPPRLLAAFGLRQHARPQPDRQLRAGRVERQYRHSGQVAFANITLPTRPVSRRRNWRRCCIGTRLILIGRRWIMRSFLPDRRRRIAQVIKDGFEKLL